ncbi:MAG: RNA polymerase sporulation sigma factor SigK [Roseburia sp.]|nr:RNA polymerase sporulation sigma factor SigK [Roseburia sp.]
MKTFLYPLTLEQETECLQRMKNGDLEARNELILRNMRLVAHVAKKYQSREEELEDLISIGTIGLIKAISTYKEEFGSRLATYAVRCIDNELLMYFRAKKKTSREMSLYEPIGTDKEGNQIQLVDVMVSEEVDVIEQMERNQKTEKLAKIISEVLSGRELFIIINRYGLFQKEPMTQREIAKKLGISRSYVSRIEKRALEKLKRAF